MQRRVARMTKGERMSSRSSDGCLDLAKSLMDSESGDSDLGR